MKNKGFTVVEALILIVVVGIVISLIVMAASLADSVGTQEQEVAPITKTRCDYTGWQTPSIIDEEAEKGYQFTGRVNTIICGDGGLSFQRKQ